MNPITPSPVLQRHGGVRPSDLDGTGLRVEQVLDFSASLNPLGPPTAVREALATLDVSRYPDPDCLFLREALSERLEVASDRILVGNGSAELIHLVVRLFVHGGQRPVVFAPTFSEFERAVAGVGGHPYPWTASARNGFRWTLRNKPGVLERVKPPLVWLCNPNNPTGVYLDRRDVELLASGLTGGPLLLDEAYVGFVDAPWSSLDLVESGRVMVLRSMTKDYAMPGVRLGYLVAHPDLIQAARELQPEWSVSSAAQVAGVAALGAEEYLQEGRRVAAESKSYLCEALSDMGLEVTRGAANFILVRVGDAPELRHRLLSFGIAVRDCTSFGLPEFIRIGMRTLTDCQALVAAMESATASALPPKPQ